MKNIKFCSLVSGSSGNCQFIETGNTKLLVDAGISGKRTEKLLKEIDVFAEDIDGILITHEHSDHIKGAGILSRRYDIPIYANEGTWEGMEKSLGKMKAENIKIVDDSEFEVGDFGIRTFDLYHDCNQPVGYTLHSGDKKVGILMDTGRTDPGIIKSIKNCDILMVESNHDRNLLKMGRYPIHLKKRIMGNWGHLSNEDAAEVIKKSAGKENGIIVLGHMSRENNFPELAYTTVSNILKEADLDSLRLEIARRESRTDIIEI